MCTPNKCFCLNAKYRCNEWRAQISLEIHSDWYGFNDFCIHWINKLHATLAIQFRWNFLLVTIFRRAWIRYTKFCILIVRYETWSSKEFMSKFWWNQQENLTVNTKKRSQKNQKLRPKTIIYAHHHIQSFGWWLYDLADGYVSFRQTHITKNFRSCAWLRNCYGTNISRWMSEFGF